MLSTTADELWRAEELAPLRASLACQEGRVREQEEALSRATRDVEHANAKQRRAERQATESAERCEWLERKLEAAKRTSDAAAEQLGQHHAGEKRAKSAAHRAETELATVKEQLLLVARSHREQEEAAAAASARESALTQRLAEVERLVSDYEQRHAAAERAIANAAATDAQHAAEVSKWRSQVAQTEAHAAEAAIRLEQQVREATDIARLSEERAATLDTTIATLRTVCDEQTSSLQEAQASLRRAETEVCEHMAAEGQLRQRLAARDAELARLQEAHARAMRDAQAENERQQVTLMERQAMIELQQGSLDKQAEQLKQRRSQLQKTAALGAQLQGIQSILSELGSLDANT